MRTLKLILPIVALAAAIGIFYTQFLSAPASSDKNTADNDPVVSDQPTTAADNSAFNSADSTSSSISTQDSVASDTSNELTVERSDELLSSENSSTQSVANTAQPSPEYPETYGYEIANNDISDEEFYALVERLKNDPFLVNELLNELRAETDPERIKRLSALLGAVGSADVLFVAEELAYSSVPATQKAGLDLLSRVARINPDAYDVAISLLSSSAEPTVLVSTMNVLAVPQNASAEIKSNAITQIISLADHESAAVRRHSVALLPRLTNDVALSPVLYNALADSSSDVRSTAIYALANYPHQSPETVERLLQLAERTEETDGVRRGAIYALQKHAPNEETQARLYKARIQMREAALAAQ